MKKSEDSFSLERAKSGIAGLDDILNGGFPKGHLFLVQGDPGTGKTTLGLQFLLAGIKAGEKGLYITLSESKAELLGVAKSHGWSLDGIDIFEMVPDEDKLNREAQYTVFHPSEIELADTTASIMRRVEESKPTRVVFDSLAELQMLAGDALRYRRQILGLKRFFTDRGLTVLMLDDRTNPNADLQIQSLAHGVLMLESLQRNFGAKRRRMEIKKLRATRFREGFHDYNILSGGIELFPRLVAAEHVRDLKRVSLNSGIEALDKLLGGGIDTGTSTLIMGPAGCGKSTVGARYVLTAAQNGDQAAIYTFDETLATMLDRASGLGLNLREHVQKGTVHVQQIDPAEMSPGEFIQSVRNQVTQRKAKVVIIDSLNGFLNAMPGESELILQMHELLSFLNQAGVATIMTMAQQGLFGAGMTSPVDLTYLADTVLLFRYYEYLGEMRQAISVIKKRTGHHERAIRELTMKPGSVSVGPALDYFEGVLTGVPRAIKAAKAS